MAIAKFTVYWSFSLPDVKRHQIGPRRPQKDAHESKSEGKSSIYVTLRNLYIHRQPVLTVRARDLPFHMWHQTTSENFDGLRYSDVLPCVTVLM